MGAADAEAGHAGEEEPLRLAVRLRQEGLEPGLCVLMSDKRGIKKKKRERDKDVSEKKSWPSLSSSLLKPQGRWT